MSDKVSGSDMGIFKTFRCPNCGHKEGLDGILTDLRDEYIFQGVEVQCPKCQKKFHFQIHI